MCWEKLADDSRGPPGGQDGRSPRPAGALAARPGFWLALPHREKFIFRFR